MYKKLFISQKGIALPLVILSFLVAAIVCYGLIVRESFHVVLYTQKECIDKAVHLADTGIEIAIGNLRIDPDYTRGPNDNVTDPVEPQFNGKGEIIFTVDSMGLGKAVVISSSIYTSGKHEYKKAVKATLTVESPGEYFLASATDFKVGRGAIMNKGNGIIYGNTIEFFPSVPGWPWSKVFRAQYVNQCIGWGVVYEAENGDTPPQGVSGTYPDGYPAQPEKVRGKMLPVISNELMEKHYANIGEDVSTSPTFSPTYDEWNFSSMSPLSSNGTTVWYCPGDLTIKSLHYNFQNTTGCVIAVRGDLIIEGDIVSPDGSSGDYGLAFIVQGDVILKTVSGANMNIKKVLFVATNGKFSVDTTNGQGATFSFSGAALFRDSFDIARGFGIRGYRYEPVVKDIENLPFMVTMTSYQPIVSTMK